MKNKKLIIFIILLIIIIFFIILGLYYKKNDRKINTVINIEDINEAYNVKTCAQKFYLYCRDYRVPAASGVYDLLDKDYIKHTGLSIDNFIDRIPIIESDKLQIRSVYKIQQKNKLSLYLVKAYELYKNKDEYKEFNILVKIDNKKNLFSVYLNDYINEFNYQSLKIYDKVNINLCPIKENLNNKFDYANKNMYDNIKDIFSNYKELCMFYEKYSYDILNDESKTERFQNYELYDKYILSIFKDIVMSKMVKYETEIREGTVIYTCYDNYGNKYIFNAKSYITYNVSIEDN